MNKVKKFIWIPIILIVAVAIVIVALCFVKVNPLLDNFGGYDYVYLFTPASTTPVPAVYEGDVNTTNAMLDNGLKSTGFSYMHAMLEGKYSYGLKLKYEDDGTEKMIDARDISVYGAYEGEYVLKFTYKEVRTLKVSDVEIKYDTVLILLRESNGEVMDIECVPYLSTNIGNDNHNDKVDENGIIGSEYYKTNILLVKMNTSRTMINIKEFINKNEIF